VKKGHAGKNQREKNNRIGVQNGKNSKNSDKNNLKKENYNKKIKKTHKIGEYKKPRLKVVSLER